MICGDVVGELPLAFSDDRGLFSLGHSETESFLWFLTMTSLKIDFDRLPE